MLIFWAGLRKIIMRAISFLYASNMQKRQVYYEFCMHEQYLIIVICVKLRRNSVEIVLHFL